MGLSSKPNPLRPSELDWKGETRRLLSVSRSILREEGFYSLLLAGYDKFWTHYRKPKAAQIGAFGELYESMLSVAESHANSGTRSATQELDRAHADRVKLIAFYLPQFHPIPENDGWWGTGFTEWTNVTKAVPQFVGHYQPRLPGELGFYDLRLIDVQKKQVELARQYGIYAFCFYYYWFDGKQLLERPLNQFLSNKKINFPFCLCWANENWTRRWDGQENQKLIEQTYSSGWEIRFIKNIESALLDKRYIRIRGRPLVIVYNPGKLPARNAVQKWRDYWRGHGNGDLYVVAARTFGFVDPRPFGFDAAVDFPPHNVRVRNVTYDVKLLNSRFLGEVFDYGKFVKRQVSLKRRYPYDVFHTVFPSWDNEPRRVGRGHVFAFSTPELYALWLRVACERTMAEFDVDKRFVFINAWNEWAEGAYLEPDRKYGRAYLEATAAVLKSLSQNNARKVH